MKFKILLIIFISTLLQFFAIVFGLHNPAAIYCTILGYNYSNGTCIFPDGSSANSWKFLLGEEKQEYGYCMKKGYEVRIISDPKECSIFLTEKCAGCLLPNGTVIEVTKLMGLSFQEGFCGDGVCGLPENYKNCSQDCPPGHLDGYCDGVIDNKCDLDCVFQRIPQNDLDCPFCGNKKCEEDENNLNCPQDCPLCGNKICEEPLENQTICCLDCGCPERLICKNNQCIEQRCGNNICESFSPYDENYKTCSKDCPSGSKDNYCDGIIDGKCDPDCREEEDVDCVKPIGPWVYLGISVVIAILLVSVIFFSKRRGY